MHKVSGISFQTRSAVKLTDPRFCSLSLEIKGAASWLRPAGLTTPNDSRGRQVLKINSNDFNFLKIIYHCVQNVVNLTDIKKNMFGLCVNFVLLARNSGRFLSNFWKLSPNSPLAALLRNECILTNYQGIHKNWCPCHGRSVQHMYVIPYDGDVDGVAHVFRVHQASWPATCVESWSGEFLHDLLKMPKSCVIGGSIQFNSNWFIKNPLSQLKTELQWILQLKIKRLKQIF